MRWTRKRAGSRASSSRRSRPAASRSQPLWNDRTMDFISSFGWHAVWFLCVLTVLVFVHELGHYLVARWNRVRVEVFSIGFGPELFGWTDRAGTRWKVSLLPFGGYVRMFGEAPEPEEEGKERPPMTEAEKAVSFSHKSLRQRAAIVVAGPVANFLLAIVVSAILFATVGQQLTSTVVGEVTPNSA